jgi:membrane associated rhomboid family serine protease
MNDWHNFFKNSGTLIRLILINVIVFAFIKIAGTIIFLMSSDSAIADLVALKLAVPASIQLLLTQPWSLISYMFLHETFFHLLFNMIPLYWAGMLFVEYLGSKKLLSTYVLGGIAGAVLYIIAYNIFPVFRDVLPVANNRGASAAVMAIVVGIATLIPEYSIGLVIFGRVKLKYLAMAYVALDFIQIAEGNAGGHIAHIGGAAFGYIYIKQLNKGNDLAAWFNSFVEWLSNTFSGKGKMKVVYSSDIKAKKRPLSDEQYAEQKKGKQAIIDKILDKISHSGYDSLSKEEKEILFKASKD